MAQTQSSIYQNTMCKEPDLFHAVFEYGPACKSRIKILKVSVLFLIVWKTFHYYVSGLSTLICPNNHNNLEKKNLKN